MVQPRDSKRARLLPGTTLDALDNDLLIQCASYLDAGGLAQLGRTSARFGIRQACQQRSLVNEAAHQRFGQSATDEERACLSNYGDESDVGLYRALELLRRPLCFDELAGNGFGPREHPASVTCSGHGGYSTAMSGHVMRGGMHFVEFTVTNHEQDGHFIHLGVIRPVSLTKGIDLNTDWGGVVNPVPVSSRYQSPISAKLISQRTAKWGDSNVHCCTYYCHDGRCSWTDWDNDVTASDWEGREWLGGSSGTVGLLLDLNQGTLSVFKNGRQLGVMKDGFGGEYCWFATVASFYTISMSRGRAPN